MSTPAAPRRRRNVLGARGHRTATAWLMALPALGFVAVLVIYPLIRGFWVSLHRWDGLSASMSWVGWRNYQNAFADSIFWGAVGNTMQYAAAVTIGKHVLALGLAVLLHRKMRGRGFFRTATFLPVVMSYVVVGLLWSFIFNPNFGLLNSLLRGVGLEGLIQGWLSDPAIALWSIIAVDIWMWTGFHVVILLAGLQSIPAEYYEAAALDGAGPWRRFWHVTLPLLRPVLTFSVLMSITGAFVSNYDLVRVMTGGGPNHATEVALTWIVKTTFDDLNVGRANAMSMILFALVVVVSVIQLRLMSRRERTV